LDCIPCPTYYSHIVCRLVLAEKDGTEAGPSNSIDPLHRIVLPTVGPSNSRWRRRTAVAVQSPAMNGQFTGSDEGTNGNKMNAGVETERVNGPQISLASQSPLSSSSGKEDGMDVEFCLIELKRDVLRTRVLGPVRIVNRFAWIARFEMYYHERQSGILEKNGGDTSSEGVRRDKNEFSKGWVGEWIIEADGTPEGRKKLQVALEGRESFLWRVMLERCAPGVIWLKLIDKP